jgi:5-formyltetrahydrofolate cyclo-ligase
MVSSSSSSLSGFALPELTNTKPTWRRWAKARRAEMDMACLSAVLVARLRALPEVAGARHLLLYLPMPGEVDVTPLAQQSGAGGEAPRCCYVPRCTTGADSERRLAVHRWVPGATPLKTSRFGVREPDPALVPETDPEVLDLVIVPALLLSEQGERIGYGGGYYDRFLPALSARCARVGVLPDALVVPGLPQDPWDQRVNLVVTETRLLRPESLAP